MRWRTRTVAFCSSSLLSTGNSCHPLPVLILGSSRTSVTSQIVIRTNGVETCCHGENVSSRKCGMISLIYPDYLVYRIQEDIFCSATKSHQRGHNCHNVVVDTRMFLINAPRPCLSAINHHNLQIGSRTICSLTQKREWRNRTGNRNVYIYFCGDFHLYWLIIIPDIILIITKILLLLFLTYCVIFGVSFASFPIFM